MQAEQPLTEDLYREKGKENPGQAGYGGSNARASLAFPTAANHRSRTGRPVFVRAAAGMQVSHRTSIPAWQQISSACCVSIHSFITRFPIRRSGALQQTFYGSPPTCPVLGFLPPCV